MRCVAKGLEDALQKINILVLTTGHEATDARIYGKQALFLLSKGFDVTVVGKLEYSTAGKVPVVAIPAPRCRWQRFLWQPWRCLWAARKIPADIVHFHDPELLFALPLAKLWWRQSKFVYDVHEDYANLILIRDWLPRWLKSTTRRAVDGVEKTLARLADGIIGVTQPLTARFDHRHKTVAHNFVAKEFFILTGTKKTSERAIDVIHVGTLTMARALFLVDTLQKFHHWKPHGRSLVAGVSPEIERLLGPRLPRQARLLGRMPHEGIAVHLGNAKIGLDIHPEPKPHLEVALPVKICEYMAAGCAVVASSLPVLNRFLNECGLGPFGFVRIDAGEPSDYAAAAVSLIEKIDAGCDPGSDLRAIAAGRMTWEGEAEKITRLYAEILHQPCAA